MVMIEKWKTPFVVKENQNGVMVKIGRVGVYANGSYHGFMRDCARAFSAEKGETIEPAKMCVQFVFFQNNADGQRRRSTLSIDESVDFGKILKQNGGDSYFCVGYRMSKKDRKAMKRGANASKSGPGANATRHEHEHEQHAGTSRFDQVKRDKDTTYAQVSHGTDVADKDRRPTPKPAAGSTSPARIHAVSPSRGGKSSGAKSVASSPVAKPKHAPKSPKSPLHDNHHRHARAHKPTAAMDDTDYFLVVKNRDPVVFPGFRRSYFGAIGTDVDDSAKKRSVPLTRDASMLMK